MIMTIDPTSYEPRHQQLVRLLRERIDAGDYKPGQRLPSEERLQQIYGLGRTTVRDALRVLRSEGTVRTVTGSGTYVRGSQEATMVEITQGVIVNTRVPTAEERRTMGLDEGVALFVIQREGQEPELLPGDKVALIVK